MWKARLLVEGRRKSARILALKEVKKNNAGDDADGGNSQNQTHVRARTAASTAKRGRKRKRLQDVGLPFQQGGENQKLGDESIKSNEAANLLSKQQVPEKRIFEFILDTLQRSDKQDIFAQPVDPQKVVTYYKIIKEPMDFGTMRAKLHEGKYTSLEQFEHDVHLISSNAMHFNASTTVFYQAAQEIQEIARRLFSSLKTDPEFLLKRGCPARKPKREDRGSWRKRGTPSGPSRKKQLGSNPQVEQRPNAKSPGLRDGRNWNLAGVQRRQTYCRPPDDNECLLSTVYNAPKYLVHVDACFRYRESLERFSEKLGPVAQMVAKRKLQSLVEAPNYQSQTTSPTQIQNYPASTLSPPGVPGHPVGVNSGQMTQKQHNSPFNNLQKDSNVSYFHGDASTHGAGICINEGSSKGNIISGQMTQMQHNSPLNLPWDSNVSYVQGGSSAQGCAPARAGVYINEDAYKGKMNVPGTSRLDLESNHSDPKGKMVLHSDMGKSTYNKSLQVQMAIDINNNLDIPGVTTGIGLHGSDMEGRADQNQNSKVRLQSHIRVVRDLSDPETSNNCMKFRTVDMLGKPNNLRNQLFQQARWSRLGSQANQSRLLESMSRNNTYLRPSSYLPSPAPKLSSLSQASSTFNDFGSQLNSNCVANSAQAGQLFQLNNNYVANSTQTVQHPQLKNYVASSAQAGQLLQLSNNYVANSAKAVQLPQRNRPGAAQGMHELIRFPNMNVELGDDHNPLAKAGMFMRKEQELASSARGIMNPPLNNAIGPHERATTQWRQNEPISESFLSLLVDSQHPNLALQL